jgi:hypothetical protein
LFTPQVVTTITSPERRSLERRFRNSLLRDAVPAERLRLADQEKRNPG